MLPNFRDGGGISWLRPRMKRREGDLQERERERERSTREGEGGRYLYANEIFS